MKNAKKFGAFAAMAAAVVFSYNAQASQYWSGRTNITENVSDLMSIADSSDTVIRQKAFTVQLDPTGDSTLGSGLHSAVYLLEGGELLKLSRGVYLQTGSYYQIRQTGGDIKIKYFTLQNPSPIRADFVFGGSGTADLGSGDYLELRGDAVVAIQDTVHFTTSCNDYKYVGVNPLTHRIWAYNGGVADYCLNGNGTLTPNCPTNDFFAFNGGKRWFRFANDNAGTDFVFGHKPDVRIYEKGGELCMRANATWSISYDFREPEGGVVASIALTPAAMSNIVDGVAQFWDVVPAVEIYEEDGVGTNAAAIVDYDYDTRTITNITVVCGGEKYSASKAKAQLIAYKDGVVTRLLETPLDCGIVTGIKGGDFTFAATNIGARINLRAHTNNLHGALIVDMDRNKLADGGKDTSTWGNTLFIEYYGTNSGRHRPRFPNCTKMIVKSGCVALSSSWGYNHQASIGFLPNCYELEMYGGHISGGSFTVTNFVVGGTAYITGHNLNQQQNNSSPYYCDVNVSSYAVGADGTHSAWKTQKVPADPGTLTVDVDSTTDEDGTHTPAKLLGGTGGVIYDDTGKTSSDAGFDPTTAHMVRYGVVRFGGTPANPCTMTIRNYESLRKTHGRKLLLDLSSDSISVFGPTNVVAVTPPDIEPLGKLQWIAEEKKLYWNSADGMMLIFR